MKRLSCAALFLLFSISAYSNIITQTICGKTDDRIPSNDPRVGRILRSDTESFGCSGALIGRNCMITAGHCEDFLKFVEFNIPSMSGVNSAKEDLYNVIDFTKGNTYSYGSDWAVIKLAPNLITKKYPGDVQGFFQISTDGAKKNSLVRVTGNGTDANDPDLNFTQQTHFGSIKSLVGGLILSYSVDTTGGNSGSPVIDEDSDEIVAIHTNGTCDSNEYSANYGTAVKNNRPLLDAINKCLSK